MILHIEISWKEEWFTSRYPSNHWNSLDNQRYFLEELAAKYSLDYPESWRKVSSSLIAKNGGKVTVNFIG